MIQTRVRRYSLLAIVLIRLFALCIYLQCAVCIHTMYEYVAAAHVLRMWPIVITNFTVLQKHDCAVLLFDGIKFSL